MASIFGSGTGFAAPTKGLAILLAGALLGGGVQVGSVDVAVRNVRSAHGELRFCLTADPINFPSCVDDARAVTRSIPAGQHGIRFDGLPRGDYALAVIHDANNNAKLDTFAGIPREGFGFSNNPPLGFGPPRFAAARFSVTSAASVQQVAMRYIL